MALTPLPDPPETADPANFATKADALVAALATMVSEINAGQVLTSGTMTTAAQPNITSLGTLTGLTLSGAIVGATSQDVFNTVSTTVNAFGAASVALNIGNASAAAAFPGGITSTKSAYVGDFSNPNSTLGLTVNQLLADDEILTLKSSDVAHGLTSLTETDTFGFFNKVSATLGGLKINGVIETGVGYDAIELKGTTVDAASTTHTAAGYGIIRVNATVGSGTGETAAAAGGNLFSVDTATATQFIVTGDGHLYANDVLAAYDEHDDIALVRAFDLAHGKGVVESKFDEFISYNERSLVDLGILGDTRANGGLVCITRLQQLHNGAIWQLATQQKGEAEYVRAEIAQLKDQLAQLEHRA